jgi:hypothetical protein
MFLISLAFNRLIQSGSSQVVPRAILPPENPAPILVLPKHTSLNDEDKPGATAIPTALLGSEPTAVDRFLASTFVLAVTGILVDCVASANAKQGTNRKGKNLIMVMVRCNS